MESTKTTSLHITNSDQVASNNGVSATRITIQPPDDHTDSFKPTELTDDTFTYDIWSFTISKDKVCLKGIYREGIRLKLEKLGYAKRYRDNNTFMLIRVKSNIIEQVEPHNMMDEAFRYVKNISEPIQFEYRGLKIMVHPDNAREVFERQSNLLFNYKWLVHLQTDDTPILKDTKTAAYFFFKNTISKISHGEITLVNYNKVKGNYIWKNHILPYDFRYAKNNTDCHYARFIHNVSNGNDDRKKAFLSAIGYLLHNYSKPTEGQAILAYDEELTDLKTPMGGTGKGLFANAIKQMRDTVKIDGKKFNPADKFRFQDINESTQVVWLDDAKPELGLEVFHSCLTDGWQVEKKHKDQITIKPEDSPKTYLTCNVILDGGGTTNSRRQFILEFSNYYSRKIKLGTEQPVREEHGCIFFDREAWDRKEWDSFYSYMMDCVCEYMTNGLQHYDPINVSRNRLRQSTSEEFYEWVTKQNFVLKKIYDTRKYFAEFVDTYYGDGVDFKQRTFSGLLKKYAAFKGWEITTNRSNSISRFSFQAVRR